MKVVSSSSDVARLANVRIRIYHDMFIDPPWKLSDGPLVYWSPRYGCAPGATDCPIGDGYLRAPVYAYEHSGVTVSASPTVPFGGVCGCVWCSVDDFVREYGDVSRWPDVVAAYVNEINAYYSGEAYGVMVEEWDPENREFTYVNGCGGFVASGGDYSALLDEMISPARRPGVVVCCDYDASVFEGLEYGGADSSVAV